MANTRNGWGLGECDAFGCCGHFQKVLFSNWAFPHRSFFLSGWRFPNETFFIWAKTVAACFPAPLYTPCWGGDILEWPAKRVIAGRDYFPNSGANPHSSCSPSLQQSMYLMFFLIFQVAWLFHACRMLRGIFHWGITITIIIIIIIVIIIIIIVIVMSLPGVFAGNPSSLSFTRSDSGLGTIWVLWKAER